VLFRSEENTIMGLIKAVMGAAGGVLADQWKEYFYCESLTENVMVTKGQKRVSGRSSNTKGEENIITTGSGIAVANGQCMIIVEQGKVLDLCAEPGEYTFDAGGEPSLFAGGDLAGNATASLQSVWERFKFGGSPGKDTRVYYFNTKELIGNKYGTPSPVPFRVVDRNIGLDIDISIRCFGEYSYRIMNPILFYSNVCGNVADTYTRNTIDGQLKSELMTALQPAFAKISEMGIRYSALPGHTVELADALNEVLSGKWSNLRGLEIVSFGVSSVKASEEDEQMIKELQRRKVGLIVLAGFLWLVPPQFVDAFTIVNIHPALLPAYGGKGMFGSFVHEAVVRNKETESGITIHLVNKEYDKGDQLLQVKCPVFPDDTPDTLAGRIHELEYKYFPQAIEDFLNQNK